MTSQHRASRRAVLKGLGVALALPWLESVLAKEPTAAAPPAAPPKPVRFASLFMGNGVNPGGWGATGTGKEMVLKPALTPLESVKEHLLVVQGLYNPNALHGEQHVAAVPNVLSCARVKPTASDIEVATSFDQILAQRLGQHTSLPSLVLGIEPPDTGVLSGFSKIYCGHISWSSPTTPIPRENNPRALYDRLVGDPRGGRNARSVLDLVSADAKRLTPELSSWDRHRLNDYLTAVREVEQRLAATERKALEPVRGPTVDKLIAAPDPVPPVDLAAHMKLMLDLLAIAFATDRTRVATFMFNNDLSKMDFSFLKPGNNSLNNLHTQSHNGGDDYTLVNRFHVQCFADFLERLKSFQEADGTVLDNSCVTFCSSLMNGGAHDRSQMPLLLAGRAGGGLKTGRTLSFEMKGTDLEEPVNRRRRLSNFYLGLFAHYGIHQPSFGDSTGRLDGL